MTPTTTALSWSGGKDSAYALQMLREEGRPPAVLLTTVDEESSRATHHHVRLELLTAQAEAAGLPLVEIPIPEDAGAEVYGERMRAAFADPRMAGVTGVAFGDLFLEELRRHREERLAAAGLEAHFPLWGLDTRSLAAKIAASCQATIVSVDPAALGRDRLGSCFDEAFLADLPEGADPCGEHGEFHTFVSACPAFDGAIAFEFGSGEEDRGFPFVDLRLTGG